MEGVEASGEGVAGSTADAQLSPNTRVLPSTTAV